MFLLVPYRDGDFKSEEAKAFLEREASYTVSQGLKIIYGTEDEPETAGFEEVRWLFTTRQFFKGLARFMPGEKDDNKAGEKLMHAKVRRMIEKMEAPEATSFDVFEELLFFYAIVASREVLHYRNVSFFRDTQEREKRITEELVNKYGYKRPKAEKLSKNVCRFSDMRLRGNQECNLFFWDNDYAYYFSGDFLTGIRALAGPEGNFAGYGYDDTIEIFTDVGLEPPLALIGTREENDIAIAIFEEKRIRLLNEMHKGIKTNWDDDK